MKQVAKTLWLPLLIVLLTLPALQPLWQSGLQQTDDGLHHLFRLFSLDQSIRAGHVGARWLADEGFGYGFPVLNFYAPLTYYVGLIWHWLGLGFVGSLEWTLALGLVLSALAMFLFARHLLGAWGGALAAVAYGWAPYHLADVWTRGALAELWAFVWFPILLLAVWQIAQRSDRQILPPVLWGGAALGGLILTHNLSLLLAAPLLMGWGLFLLFVEVREPLARWRCLGGFSLMVVIGFVVSAAFWLPAIAESKYVLAGQSPERFVDWVARLVRPQLLLAESWRQPYTIQDRRIEHALGLAQALIALLGFSVGIWRRRRLSRVTRMALPLWAGLLLFGLFMQSEWSAQVWRGIPGLLLLQFPWRWQSLGVVSTALLSGSLAYIFPWTVGAETQSLNHSSERWHSVACLALVLLVGVLLMSSALPGIPWERAQFPTTDTVVLDDNVNRQTMTLYDFGRGLWLREYGNPWLFEYMPIWVQTPRDQFFLSAGSVQTSETPLAVQLTPGRQAPLERHFAAISDTAWKLQLHQFYFPGWEARVDGRTVVASPTGPLALAGAEIPAGEHEVVLRFGSTPARRIGWALTLVGAGAWVAAAVWLQRWRWLTLLMLVIAIYGGLALATRLATPADYMPTAISANLGGQGQLVGFYAPAAQLRPEASSEVILTWLALRQPAADYKVFVHLVDLNGKLWAQHDGEPGFYFSPTTRWQRGEIVEDRHILTWKGAPPPGRYQLRIGLYDPKTGDRLPVFAADGTVIGDQVLLFEFGL